MWRRGGSFAKTPSPASDASGHGASITARASRSTSASASRWSGSRSTPSFDA